MPKNYPYPLQMFVPKLEEYGCALSNLLADGFGDRFRGINRNTSFVRNVAESTLIAEYLCVEFLSRKQIPYSPAPQLSTLEGVNIYLYGKFKSIKVGELKKLIKANGGKCAASYSKNVNIVLIGDDVGSYLDRNDYTAAMRQVEIALARKWLGTEVAFVSEADFFKKNSWLGI